MVYLADGGEIVVAKDTGPTLREELERLGIPSYVRIEIPLGTRRDLGIAADVLVQLAGRLKLYSTDLHYTEVTAITSGWTESRQTGK